MIYHEDDKEGLRRFLQQPSVIAGRKNCEVLGLQISDMTNWKNSEAWVAKIWSLIWNNESPKRLITIYWSRNNLAGALDASKWKKLTYLSCYHNQLTALDVSTNTELKELICSENPLTALDVSVNPELTTLWCSGNQLTTLNMSKNMALTELWCYNNRLTLSDLFAASERITKLYKKWLGTQNLLPQTISTGRELFSKQAVFNGIYTNYAVTKNNSPAPESDITVTDGKIIFNRSGNYTVTMTNEAVKSYYYPAKVVVEVEVVD